MRIPASSSGNENQFIAHTQCDAKHKLVRRPLYVGILIGLELMFYIALLPLGVRYIVYFIPLFAFE